MILRRGDGGRRSGRGGAASRARRTARPTLEALEARLALATSALDPTFGVGGVALGPAASNLYNTLEVAATAVQPDGKVVVVESANGDIYGVLTVFRFDADGSVDSSFGTDGRVVIPAPGADNSVGPVGNVAIDPDGRIYLATEVEQSYPLGSPAPSSDPPEHIVVRLTPAGRLDPTFGTGGEAVIQVPQVDFRFVAVQPDGKVVVAGNMTQRYDPATGEVTPGITGVALARLTAAGAPDATFDGTGTRAIAVPATADGPASESIAALAIAPGGRILVAGNRVSYTNLPGLAFVARADADGSADASFGTGGATLVATPGDFGNATSMAVGADGAIILAGSRYAGPGNGFAPALVRVGADGAVDPTFHPPAAANPADTYSQVVVGPDGAITVGGSTPYGVAEGLLQRTKFLVERFLADGTPDPAFGRNGRDAFVVDPTPVAATVPTAVSERVAALALDPAGRVVVAALARTIYFASSDGAPGDDVAQLVVARLLPIATARPVAGDYVGDGRADIAAELAAFGLFAYRASGGTGDVVEPFGPTGVGQVIPAPGDYDGDGRTDLAVYLPNLGEFLYRPSSGGADVVVPFGTAGAGNSIPDPGDYDGDGRTDFAVYLPASGTFAYRPSHGGPDVLVPFGTAGAGMSIPAPGDYDGDGVTDIAVYLPTYGVLAYRPSSGTADVLTPFGIPGPGATIPAPGDYDGDGKTDVAAYFPGLGIYAYRPSSGGADVVESFGRAGAGNSIPVPGDYDGDGKADLAVYLPASATFADRPSGGGPDVIQTFGAAGAGQTVLAAALPDFSPTTTPAVVVPLPSADDVATPAANRSRRKGRGHLA